MVEKDTVFLFQSSITKNWIEVTSSKVVKAEFKKQGYAIRTLNKKDKGGSK